MKTAASLSFAAALLFPASLLADPQPAQDSEEGRTAWNLLNGLYAKDPRGDTDLRVAVDKALRDLSGDDETKAAGAAGLLQAILIQAKADETNGRAAWQRSPEWGGGGRSAAREYRRHLSERLGQVTPGAAAAPLAAWILANERLPESLNAAVLLLKGNRSAAADTVLVEIVKRGTHWRPALELALTEAGSRQLVIPPEDVIKWAADGRLAVRSAAQAAIEALKISPPPAYAPENAFSPDLEKLLANILALLPTPPAGDARFGSLTVVTEFGNGEKHSDSTAGWLLGEEGGTFRFLTWFGELQHVETGGPRKSQPSFKPMEPAEAVAEIRKIRETKDKDGRSEASERLSPRGGLTGQFEPRQISLPEGLMSAWLFSKGERALTAKLLFPLLDDMSDDRWAFEILRDLQGGQVHQAMLDAFSWERDYNETLRLARHLSQPLFDGYNYQSRAKELASQLPGRLDDFKTFALPAPEEWKETAAGLPRDKQIEFLASRLRLLNCFQAGQPGDVDYRDPQYSVTGPQWNEKEIPKGSERINPYNELRRLRLTAADVVALAVFLKDDSFLPTYSYWRDFHPARTLHRVNWLVADLVNTAARRTLIDLDGWQGLEPAERDARIGKVTEWAASMAGKSPAEILRANMKEAATIEEWRHAAAEAARSKDPSLMADLLVGAERFPEDKDLIAKLCFQHGDASALNAARLWMKVGEPPVKLYSALMVIRHGEDTEKPAAHKVLSGLLGGEWNEELVFNGAEPLLSLQDDAVTAILCGVLRRPELEWSWTGAELAHRLFLTKHPDALAAILEALNSTEDAKEEQGEWEKTPVTRKRTKADRVAEGVSRFRKASTYPGFAPDSERAAARAALAQWLTEQAALLKDGKPTPDLNTDEPRIQASEWQIDAP